MTTLHLIASTEDRTLWEHPNLEFFPREVEERGPLQQSAKLYLVPTSFGESFEPGFEPTPTSALELPDIHQWSMKFIIATLEIWAGKRQPAQLISWCHRVIYGELLRKVGSQREIGKIRTIHQNQPIDGVCECAVTVRYGDRLRVVVIRFEGRDERWLCTELYLI